MFKIFFSPERNIMESANHFDLIVIGAGSGGIASARWTAKKHGTKAAIVEHQRLGGTCVNVGCVPKKVMFNAASFIEDSEVMHSMGIKSSVELNWPTLKKNRDAYVKRLNVIYQGMLSDNNIPVYKGWGAFVDDHTIEVEGQKITADHVLIACGSTPIFDEKIPGIEHCISSDGFFELEEQPKRALVVGGGYIGLEMAQIWHCMGTKTTLLVRKDIITWVDVEVRQKLLECMEIQGFDIRMGFTVKKIEKQADGSLQVEISDGTKLEVDVVLMATGRKPLIE